MPARKTPGVYVVEKNAFPNSVVEVATAVPAFIGYTEQASNGNQSLQHTPWRIKSLAEYEQYFGTTPDYKFSFAKTSKDAKPSIEIDLAKYTLKRSDQFCLYQHLKLFFLNGGNACYIISSGFYSDKLDQAALLNALDLLQKEQEPTLVLIPEAVLLEQKACYELQNAMIDHCGKMQNRFAILDVYDGYKNRNDESGDVIADFRANINSNYLSYASAYYPWLNTSLISMPEVSFRNIQQDDLAAFLAALKQYSISTLHADIDKIDTELTAEEQVQLHQLLFQQSPFYASIINELLQQLNLMAPASAMAGVYTMVDDSRGVWKAPANVALPEVLSVSVDITSTEQEDLNGSLDGKTINAIRNFPDMGTMVWGARTLDGNSLDWRYINVRRTMIMLEESIKLATKAYAFEPNTANTWVTVRAMISNLLLSIWKRGGLAGATPEDAFSVHVGLGETMTADDILDGLMNITVLVAISKPAEFIEITFQQQMQKS